MTNSDLIIIGGGPGGYETAARAAALGKNVTLIERDLLGGTCLNRGCIPTKALCRSAQVVSDIANAVDFGIELTGNAIEVSYTYIMQRKDYIVGQLREGVETLLKDVNVVKGEARFEAANVVDVEGEKFTAPEIIIATGAKPASLPIPGAEYAVNSDFVLSCTSFPQRIVIIGAGVIGMEFASIFRSFGIDVTVLEYCKEILPPFDAEVAKRLRMSLKKRGINIVTDAQVTAIEPNGTVSYLQKGKEKSVESEMVVMAVGRTPVVPEGLAELGVKFNRKAIAVNDRFEVEFEEGRMPADVKLYAVGDVNARMMLAHVASAQGAVVLGETRNLDVVPSAVFTMPEAAIVGLTEQQCVAKGLNIKIGKSIFRANGKAMAMGEPDGMVKVIVDADTDLILGCHIVGPHAADLIQEPTLAMTTGLTAKQVADTIHAHPTLGEAVLSAFE